MPIYEAHHVLKPVWGIKLICCAVDENIGEAFPVEVVLSVGLQDPVAAKGAI